MRILLTITLLIGLAAAAFAQPTGNRAPAKRPRSRRP